MKTIGSIFGIALLFAACGDMSQNTSSVAGATASQPQPTSAVTLRGPWAADLEVRSLIQNEGAAMHVEVDHRTVHACYANALYQVKDLGRGTWLVERTQLMHTMMMCMPGMERDFVEGIAFDIPASHQYGSYATVIIRGASTPADFKATTADASLKIDEYKSTKKADDFSIMTNDKPVAYKVLVDRKTIKGCYSSVAYTMNKLGNGRFYVQAQHIAVPMFICLPNMARDIEVGTEFTIPASEKYSYVSLLVERLNADTAADVKIVPVKE